MRRSVDVAVASFVSDSQVAVRGRLPLFVTAHLDMLDLQGDVRDASVNDRLIVLLDCIMSWLHREFRCEHDQEPIRGRVSRPASPRPCS
jgi:hypothetical protein